MAAEKDIVLIYYEGNPLLFARIERILPDARRDWYHVTLLLLQVPPQRVTWILRNAYINGDSFTMDGKQMRLEVLEPPQTDKSAGESNPLAGKAPDTKTKGSVISLKDFKRQPEN